MIDTDRRDHAEGSWRERVHDSAAQPRDVGLPSPPSRRGTTACAGGCWCTWFHRGVGRDFATTPRALREAGPERASRPRGRAHAALVCDGDAAVAWCQYGPPEEFPHIYYRKEYEAGLERPPTYRLTCLFVDRDYRRQGVAAVAVQGALDQIAKAGGGIVEAYPQDTKGRRVGGLPLQRDPHSVRGGRFSLRAS